MTYITPYIHWSDINSKIIFLLKHMCFYFRVSTAIGLKFRAVQPVTIQERGV
jgi:hypothetical protein